MPTQKSKLNRVAAIKQIKQRRRAVVGAGAGALLAVAAFSVGKLIWSGGAGQLDTSNGVKLLPQDTLLTVAIATDAERWQKLNEFGVPVSRGVLESQIAKFQAEYLTPYGYDYQRDIQPWIGKQILFGYLNNPAINAAKGDRGRIPNPQLVAILSIADLGAAQRTIEQQETPSDANFAETNYKGVSIREFRRKAGTIAMAIVDNYAVLASDRASLQQVIDAQQSGKSILAVPGYTKALTAIAIERPFAQVYLNVPVATAVAAANAPASLAADKLAQAQTQQGIAANATLESTGIAWKGISWLKPNSKQKFTVDDRGRDLGGNLPSDTLVMISGGNLQRLWQDFARSADSPLAPVKPQEITRSLYSWTGLDLESEILNWSKAPFGVAIVPKSTKVDTEFGAGLVWLQQASDRSAADKALSRLDNNIQKQGYKVAKAQINGQDAINWTTPIGNVAASRGWLGNNTAYLNLGAPVATTFVPQPAQNLAGNPLFQQSMRSSLNPHNGQFFIDIDRTINAGNLPLPALSPEVAAGFKAIEGIGVTSAILDESSNRFDMFVTLKQVPGVAKLPTPAKPKTDKPKTDKPVKATASPTPKP